MISFVWPTKFPFVTGAGGSEAYTAGHIRELQRRGIATRVITIGFGTNDGRDAYPDFTFTDLPNVQALSDIDDTLVFVTYPVDVPTRSRSYAILHCSIASASYAKDPLFEVQGAAGKGLIAPSQFAAQSWAEYLQTEQQPAVVYPFADAAFSRVVRLAYHGKKTRVLFAGRPVADKGIYTLFAALQMYCLDQSTYDLRVVVPVDHLGQGRIITKLLEAHPLITTIPARHSPEAMAKLLAESDVLVMPSTGIFWKEFFGMLSVEAQQAGCRVVGSDSGGLPETDCGGLLLVAADNPLALAEGMARAIKLGPLTTQERRRCAKRFTVEESVDALLRTISEGTKFADHATRR